jgi:5-methylcytosine-specific restriction endonuclease McrA
MKKICSRCTQEKDIIEFSRDRRKKDGLRTYCKKCGRETFSSWLDKNREERKKYCREWHKEHRESERKKHRQWKLDNPEKNAAHERKRRQNAANVGGEGITVEQQNQLYEDYCYRCAYCGKKVKLTLDHIVPVSKGGRHEIDNAVPACASCNSSKGNKSLLLFMRQQNYLTKSGGI